MGTYDESWKHIQALVGEDFKYTNNVLCKEMPDGTRIEITGTCNDTFKRHFNIYIIQNGVEIAQSTGIPQDKLASEIDTLCSLI